ncbi:MAG: hypothetical protein GF355_10095, partial [Candidatus Eisenbacteria bacterium]|nr:hypothetical protein [Candidatus Eisenbacteria bacterium]
MEEIPQTRDTRARIAGFAALLVFAVILAQLVHLQGLDGAEMRKLSTDTRIRPEIIRAPRGRILDRDGRVLAGNQPSFYLTLDLLHPAYRDRRPSDSAAVSRGEHRLQETLRTLAQILDLPVDRLEQRLDRIRSDPAPMTFVRHLDFAQRSRIWERARLLPGVSIDSYPLRHYPHGTLAAHALGYLGEVTREELAAAEEDNLYHRESLLGRAGLERAYEGHLRNRDRQTHVEVDALGRKRDLYEGLTRHGARAGGDLVTSLDLELQQLAEAAFDSVVPERREGGGDPERPPAGAVVVLDCRSGDV